MPTKRAIQPSRSRALTIGLEAFTSISAVEGVRLEADSRRMFAEFDRRRLTDAERRRAIAEKHARKA